MAMILVVDDDPSNILLLTMLLEDNGHTISSARTGAEGLELASKVHPDAILLDVYMPVMDGLECLKAFKSDSALSDVPVIMVSGEDRDERVIEALDFGASDYVTKPFSERVLLARLNSALRLKQSQDALREANRRLEMLASIDPLTGLYNRRAFFDLAERELGRARRYDRPVVLGLLDVDHFKPINDQYGHLVGDQVLQRISELCRLYFRNADIVGRYGGEEFVLCMPDTSLQQALVAGERFCNALSAAGVSVEQRGTLQKIPVTVSIGIATYDNPSQGLKEIIDLADVALYRAKSEGRNRVVLSSPSEAF